MRLLVHVEGQTEETFVNEILRTHLFSFGFTSVSPRLLGNARLRRHRGGVRAWPSVRTEIIRHLKEDGKAVASLIVDFYGMPATPPNGWPGRDGRGALPPGEKATFVERSLVEDIARHYGAGFKASRFVPLVAMHEFEALLFSDCTAFAEGIGRADLAPDFQQIRNLFVGPEYINDSPLTAPSKRVLDVFPTYDKPFHGNLAIIEIGLPTIREECPHFDSWLSLLEKVATEAIAEE